MSSLKKLKTEHLSNNNSSTASDDVEIIQSLMARGMGHVVREVIFHFSPRELSKIVASGIPSDWSEALFGSEVWLKQYFNKHKDSAFILRTNFEKELLDQVTERHSERAFTKACCDYAKMNRRATNATNDYEEFLLMPGNGVMNPACCKDYVYEEHNSGDGFCTKCKTKWVAERCYTSSDLILVLAFQEIRGISRCVMPSYTDKCCALLYDRWTLELVSGIGIQRKMINVTLPNNKNGCVVILCAPIWTEQATHSEPSNYRLIVWHVSSGKQYILAELKRCRSCSTAALLRAPRTSNLLVYFTCTCDDRRGENLSSVKATVYKENNAGDGAFQLIKEGENLDLSNVWFCKESNELDCLIVAGLTVRLDPRPVVYQFRSKDDFSLLRTAQVGVSIGTRALYVPLSWYGSPPLNGATDADVDDYEAYYFDAHANPRERTIEIRSTIQDRRLVHVFHYSNVIVWENIHVKFYRVAIAGALFLQVTKHHGEMDNLFVKQLPGDFFDSCRKRLMDRTGDAVHETIELREIVVACGTNCRLLGTDHDAYGMSRFVLDKQNNNVNLRIVKI